MGLETDSERSGLWVDLYGDGITRDLEPTVEDGGALWSIFLSCMRVLRTPGGCTATDAGSEPCCDAAAPSSSWVPVWSLTNTGAKDYLLTVDKNERDSLVKGGGWTEICSPFGGGGAFCSYDSRVDPVQYVKHEHFRKQYIDSNARD